MIPLADIALFERYEELKKSIKIAEAEAKEIQPKLLELMPKDSSIKTGRGTFSTKTKATWQYSPMTQADATRLKASQELEQQDGTATQKQGEPFLEYRENKQYD